MLFLNLKLSISFFFLQIFPEFFTNIFFTNICSKVYFIFLISVFAIFSFNNLNVYHRNFDVNRNHVTVTTLTTQILDINRIRYCGEMADPHFDQYYSKYILQK